MKRAFSPDIFRLALLSQPVTPQRTKCTFAGDPVLGWAGIAARLWRFEAARFAHDFGSAGHVVAVACPFMRLPWRVLCPRPTGIPKQIEWVSEWTISCRQAGWNYFA